MTTQAHTSERVFKVEKFYRSLFEESNPMTSHDQQASPELIIERLRELVPLLAFTKAVVVMEERPHGC